MAITLIPKRYGERRLDKSKLAKSKQDLANDPPEPPRSPSPFAEHLDKPMRKTFFTGRPIADQITLVQCKTCKRPMISHVSAPHIKSCVQKHKEKVQRKKEQKEANRKAREARDKEQRAAEAEEAARALAEAEDDDDDDGEGEKRPTGSKKRKAGDEGEKGPLKKKTKKELEALAAKDKKAAKPKGPVDVERQCGVPLPNGGACARSLTCKSHPMGAKRAVPGRSKPYDILLQQYQKKNQAKQQKAAIEANAEKEEDFVDPRGPVDSDEEKEMVVNAISRWRPQPAVIYTPVPIRKRYNYIRIHDALGQALRGSALRAAGSGSTSSAAASGAATGDASGSTSENAVAPSSEDKRRQSSGGQRPTALQNPGHGSRKASMASQAGIGTPTASTPTVDIRA